MPTSISGQSGTEQLLIDVEEARRRVDLGRSTFYRLLATGSIPSCRMGRRRLVFVDGLEEFVRRLSAEAHSTEPDGLSMR
jgi:excisionase family DNA binding protein